MRGAAALALAAAVAALPSRAPAQICPFGIAWSYSGTACPQAGALAPTITGAYTNGVNGCSVTLTLGPPGSCCSLVRYFVIGGQANIPIPGGCPLLVSPDVVVLIPAAAPSMTFPLPPSPALIGSVVYAQGAIVQFVVGVGNLFNFTNRLEIAFA